MFLELRYFRSFVTSCFRGLTIQDRSRLAHYVRYTSTLVQYTLHSNASHSKYRGTGINHSTRSGRLPTQSFHTSRLEHSQSYAQCYDSCFCITRHSHWSGGLWGLPSQLTFHSYSIQQSIDGAKSHFHRLLHHLTASFTKGRMMFIQQTFLDNNNNPKRQWCGI